MAEKTNMLILPRLNNQFFDQPISLQNMVTFYKQPIKMQNGNKQNPLSNGASCIWMYPIVLAL